METATDCLLAAGHFEVCLSRHLYLALLCLQRDQLVHQQLIFTGGEKTNQLVLAETVQRNGKEQSGCCYSLLTMSRKIKQMCCSQKYVLHLPMVVFISKSKACTKWSEQNTNETTYKHNSHKTNLHTHLCRCTFRLFTSFTKGSNFPHLDKAAATDSICIQLPACAHRVAQTLLKVSWNQGKSSKFEPVCTETCGVAEPCGSFTMSA